MNEALAEECSDKKLNFINEELGDVDTMVGDFKSINFWRLKKKLFPQSRDPPSAMINTDGHITTNSYEIKEAAKHTFEKRLRANPIKEEYVDLMKARETLFRIRMSAARKRITPPWTKDHLNKVLMNLKKNKC